MTFQKSLFIQHVSSSYFMTKFLFLFFVLLSKVAIYAIIAVRSQTSAFQLVSQAVVRTR